MATEMTTNVTEKNESLLKSAWMIAVGGTHSYDYPQAQIDFIAAYQY